jgi:hypothetical protein
MPGKQACHKTLMAAPLYKVVPLFHIYEEPKFPGFCHLRHAKTHIEASVKFINTNKLSKLA